MGSLQLVASYNKTVESYLRIAVSTVASYVFTGYD